MRSDDLDILIKKFQQVFDYAFHIGYEKGKSDRLTGEWNYIQAGMAVCPLCGAMPHKYHKNFCAKCGAELKVVTS